MKKFFILFLIALVSCETDLDAILFQQFQKFIKKYQKNYSSMNEFLARFEVFKRNVIQLFKEKGYSHKIGITKFSDLTKQEFAKTYLNLNYDAFAYVNFEPVVAKNKNSAPDYWNWAEKGCVGTIKDQGSCGSCWAFAAMGNLECLYNRYKGLCKTFSEQMMVDCDTKDSGCNGGLMQYAFSWLASNGGIMTDADYPYVGKKQTCQSDATKYVDMKITGYKKLAMPKIGCGLDGLEWETVRGIIHSVFEWSNVEIMVCSLK